MPVTITQLRASATVDLMTAAAALGLGRTKAYELARREQFPCRVNRIGEHTDRVAFGPGRYRIGHAVFRVLFEARRGRRPASVTVKVKPPSIAAFKRQRYEARVMELLRRNRFCREREPAEAAVAAE